MFVAKVLERVAFTQLQDNLRENVLFFESQFAHRRFHTPKTALLRVRNDLLLAIDKGLKVIFVLLDFSSAFDTIDHNNLIKRLRDRYDIGGTALNWFRSYLDDRDQRIVINDVLSK